MSSSTKRIKKKGGLSALIKRTRTPGTVDAGIIDAGNHPSRDITVAGIGFAHEFGTATLPERSFMRSTTQEKKKDILPPSKKTYEKKLYPGDMKSRKTPSLFWAKFMG